MAAREMTERGDREREPEAEARGDSERPDRVEPDVDRDGDPLKPRKKKRNVPIASAPRRTLSG